MGLKRRLLILMKWGCKLLFNQKLLWCNPVITLDFDFNEGNPTIQVQILIGALAGRTQTG